MKTQDQSKFRVLLGAGLACLFVAAVTIYENWPTEDIYSEVPKELTGRKSAHDFIWHNAVPLKHVTGARLAPGGIIPGLDNQDNVDHTGGFREEFSFGKLISSVQGVAVIAIVLGGCSCLAVLVVTKGREKGSAPTKARNQNRK